MVTGRRLALVILPLALLVSSFVLPLQVRSSPAPSPGTVRVQGLAALPLRFEPNRGQAPRSVRFIVRGSRFSGWLTAAGAVIRPSAPGPQRTHGIRSAPPAPRAHDTVFSMRFADTRARPKIAGADPLPGKVNYFMGADSRRWLTDIPTYGKVVYHNVYAHIDLVFRGGGGGLEYDWIVRPGALPGNIRMRVGGHPVLDRSGSLVIRQDGTTVMERRPSLYQLGPSGKIAVPGRFVVSHGSVGFSVGSYDRRRPLTIDPALSVSTYLGGIGPDVAAGITSDGSGNVYLTGSTGSINFPGTPSSLERFDGGLRYVFVTKMSAAGNTLLYSTYLGGDFDDEGSAIAVDGSGNAYVTGETAGSFPTVHAAQKAFGGGTSDAFIAKLNAAGNALVYSTYLGGKDADVGNGIAVDASGGAYVVGATLSSNFPTLSPLRSAIGAEGADAFAARLNPDGSRAYSTYLGGSAYDEAFGVAVDGAGDAYVAGTTSSADFVMSAQAVQPLFGGGTYDAFLVKLRPSGRSMIFGTYIGGAGDDGAGAVAVDTDGNAYVTGTTGSPRFPLAHPAQRILRGGTDAYVVKASSDGRSLLYSTYLGGTGDEWARGIALLAGGDVAVVGSTSSPDFTTVSPTQPFPGGGQDAFITRFDAGGTIRFSTYLGGSGDDLGGAVAAGPAGRIYVAGATSSADFPVRGAVQRTNHGALDAFLVAIDQTTASPPPTPTPGPAHKPYPSGTTLLERSIDAIRNKKTYGVELEVDGAVAGLYTELFRASGSVALARPGVKIHVVGTAETSGQEAPEDEDLIQIGNRLWARNRRVHGTWKLDQQHSIQQALNMFVSPVYIGPGKSPPIPRGLKTAGARTFRGVPVWDVRVRFPVNIDATHSIPGWVDYLIAQRGYLPYLTAVSINTPSYRENERIRLHSFGKKVQITPPKT